MLRKQIKFTCSVLQLLTWRMKELMGNITGVCRIWDKHQFLMPSLNLMPGLKLWVCFWVSAYVCVWCHFWGQPKRCLVNAVGSKGSTDHNGIFRLSHTQESLPVSSCVFFHLLPFCITLFIWSPLSLLLPHWIVHFPPSLAPSLSLQGTILCCLSTRGCYLKHLEVI